MSVELTDRARNKGILEVEMLSTIERPDFIVCSLYEKREKNGIVVEWLDPTIIFKTPVKHKDYERAIRLTKEAGIFLIFPEAEKFQTDYYGLRFNGQKTIIKSWGYTSNHSPVSKRLSRPEIEDRAAEWMNDFVEDVEFLNEIVIMVLKRKTDEHILDWIRQKLKESAFVES